MKIIIRSFCQFILVLIFSLAVSQLPLLPALAEENITITTYYPSPSGSYLDLNVARNLTLQSVPLVDDGPQIQWRTNNSRHWNIDQNGNRLRFYTEDINDLNGEERLEITDDNMMFIGSSGNGNFIFRAPDGAANDAGDIIFQARNNNQKGRIWTESATANSGLYLSSGNNTADIVIDSDGDVGIGMTTPSSKLDVAGGINASAGVKVGTVSSSCNSSRAGTMRYNSSSHKMEYCDGSDWNPVGGAGTTRIRTAGGGGAGCGATVSCNSDEMLTGGGCRASGSGVGSLGGYPSGNTWRCDAWTCTGGSNLTAYAICLK